MNTIVIRDPSEPQEWGVSFTNSNPEEKDFFPMPDEATALRLQKYLAEKGKEDEWNPFGKYNIPEDKNQSATYTSKPDSEPENKEEAKPDWAKIAHGANIRIQELKDKIKILEKGKEEHSWIELLERASWLVGNPGTNISGSTDLACENWQKDYEKFKANK